MLKKKQTIWSGMSSFREKGGFYVREQKIIKKQNLDFLIKDGFSKQKLSFMKQNRFYQRE